MSLTPEKISAINNLKQSRMNSLISKTLSTNEIDDTKKLHSIIDILAVCIPIIYYAPTIIAKGTVWENSTNNIGIIVSAILLSLVVFKSFYKSNDYLQKCIKILHENMTFISDVNNLISKIELDSSNFNKNEIEAYSKLSDNIERHSQETFTKVSDSEKQKSYRQALKELNCICPSCNSDPWKFKRSWLNKKCQLCGNLPINNKKENVL